MDCYIGIDVAKATLDIAAFAGVRWNPVLRAPADRGKPFQVAVTACMRKLLTILNAMRHDQQPWMRNTLDKQHSC